VRHPWCHARASKGETPRVPLTAERACSPTLSMKHRGGERRPPPAPQAAAQPLRKIQFPAVAMAVDA